MKYYKLLYDYSGSEKFVFCSIGYLGFINRYSLSKGSQITDWREFPIFEYTPSDGSILSDYLANVFVWLVVSKKFRRVSEHLVNNSVQYLDVIIRNTLDNVCDNTYKAANVIDVVDAIDFDKSVYDTFTLEDRDIISFNKYVFKKEAVEGHHIFKLKDDTIPIFISETLKKLIEKNRMQGFDFCEVTLS